MILKINAQAFPYSPSKPYDDIVLAKNQLGQLKKLCLKNLSEVENLQRHYR